MSLAKERMVQDSHLGLIQSCSFYENVYGGSSIQVMDPSLGLHGIDNYPKILLEEEGGSAKTNRSATWVKSFNSNRLPLLSDTSNVNCSPFVIQTSNSPPGEAQSLIFNFKAGSERSGHSSGSLLSFEKKEEDYSTWADTVNQNIQWNQPSHKDGTAGSRLSEDLSCFETACSYDSMNSSVEEIQHGDERFGWLYSVAAAADGIDQSGREEVLFHKRPHMGSEMQASKKQCNGAARKPKPKSIPSKDPQSIAAKNRRERISERLKILQELVPNGSKVDLVTMLEKAISYVKFLQLQVKVLATDEFWPAQGGKAPEVGQVKEAIDEILSSHKNKNPISKCERPFG